jgi:8-oxo-dGTP pyrophosphatase MutT (NUDIX family)
MDNVNGSNISDDGWVDDKALEKEIVLKGTFYKDPDYPDQEDGFYCVVNKLTVYKGHIMEDGSMRITTVYPYTPKIKGLLLKLPKIEIPAIQKVRDDLEATLKGKSAKYDTYDLQGLRNYLTGHNIQVDNWGKGSAKTLEHLLKEINEGETVLVEKGDELLREIKVASITVLYEKDGETYVLSEKEQVFSGGRKRERTKPKGSLSEKFKSNEEPNAAAKRAIQEELGIVGDINLTYDGEAVEIGESQSFPGLKTSYNLHRYTAKLTDKQYKPEYVEEQDDKKTFFVWKKQGKEQTKSEPQWDTDAAYKTDPYNTGVGWRNPLDSK